MKPICDMKEMQFIQVEIMKKVHSFCERHKITYYLSHGTLIGAIRHQGFIPWDDDIDIFMPREDYERFCKLFPAEQSLYELELANSNTKTYFGRPMSKVIDCRTVLIEPAYLGDDELGVNIDIWPLDGVPEGEMTRKLHFFRLKVLLGVLYGRISRTSSLNRVLYKFIHFALLPIPPRVIVNRIIALAQRYKYMDSNEVTCYVDPYVKVFKKEYFEGERLCKFGNDEFCIPFDAEQVLKELYGDYMKLPPKEKQIAHHTVEAYWKTKR